MIPTQPMPGGQGGKTVVKAEDATPSEQAPFRYRWQKKPKPQPVAASGSRDNERAYLERDHHDAQVANPSKEKKRSVSKKVDDDYCEESTVEEESDDDYMPAFGSRRRNDDGQDEDGDGDWDPRGSGDNMSTTGNGYNGRSHARNNTRTKKDTKTMGKKNAEAAVNGHRKHTRQGNGAPHPNGRVAGRSLVHWHRARMIDKLVLIMVYECHRSGSKIPWDDIVHRLCPGSSGQAAVQHLQKLRDILLSQGHMVPPLMGRRGVAVDETIRGYVRDMDSAKPTDSRVLRWDEPYPDLKESLVVEGTVTGSGNYKRDKNYMNSGTTTIEKLSKNADGSRRNRLPKELTNPQAKTVKEVKTTATELRKSDRKARRVMQKLAYNERDSSPDSVASIEDYEEVDKFEPSPSPGGSHSAARGPEDAAESRVASHQVILRLPAQALQQFPRGNSQEPTSEVENEGQAVTLTDNAMDVTHDAAVQSSYSDAGSESGYDTGEDGMDEDDLAEDGLAHHDLAADDLAENDLVENNLAALDNVENDSVTVYHYTAPDYGHGTQSGAPTPSVNMGFTTDMAESGNENMLRTPPNSSLRGSVSNAYGAQYNVNSFNIGGPPSSPCTGGVYGNQNGSGGTNDFGTFNDPSGFNFSYGVQGVHPGNLMPGFGFGGGNQMVGSFVNGVVHPHYANVYGFTSSSSSPIDNSTRFVNYAGNNTTRSGDMYGGGASRFVDPVHTPYQVPSGVSPAKNQTVTPLTEGRDVNGNGAGVGGNADDNSWFNSWVDVPGDGENGDGDFIL